MIERVRAVLVTPTNEIVTIRRERPGTPTYWVLPGGHVDDTDPTREDALAREICEELAGTPRIHGLLHILDGDTDRQCFYLGRIGSWSFDGRTGPEFQQAGGGQYRVDLIPLTAADLAKVDLKPDAIGNFLRQTLADHVDLFTLPDLRVAHGRA